MGPIRLGWIASEVAISEVSKKITRRHNRRESGRNGDAKGERFSLQGKRWRFPRELGPEIVETRKSRIRELWSDHEQFHLSQVFVAPERLSSIPEQVAENEAKRILQEQSVASASEHLADETRLVIGWSAFGSSSKNGGVTLACREAEWSPLALWIAEQLRQGVQPVPLPPLPELMESVCHKDRVDYRFGHLAELFLGPPEAYPPVIDDLRWQDAFQLLNRLTEVYPSVPWTMPRQQVDDTAEFHEQVARKAIFTTARVRPQKTPALDIPLIPGSFHEALRKYRKKRENDFTTGEEFNGSGHHMLSLIDNFKFAIKAVLASASQEKQSGAAAENGVREESAEHATTPEEVLDSILELVVNQDEY